MSDLFAGDGVPIEAQIAAVEREIQKRAEVYPRLIAAGKMSPSFADEQERAMRAVLITLRQVASGAKVYSFPVL